MPKVQGAALSEVMTRFTRRPSFGVEMLTRSPILCVKPIPGAPLSLTGANMVLSELYTDFGTPEGQKAMKINLDEVVSKYGK